MNYFCLTNDPDHGVTDDYKKIFEELSKNSIYITTAIFCCLKNDNSALSAHCNSNETSSLEDKEYKNLMLKIRDEGHEIAFHGYSQSHDSRDEFQRGIDIYKDVFGEYPSIYIEHGGHKSKHPKEMVKNENLSNYGAVPSSKYFIKDIIRDCFNLVWTHDNLNDNIDSVMQLEDSFIEIEGITYFNRWRMRDFKKVIKSMNGSGQSFIGYTHFGYPGYRRRGRNIIKNLYMNRTSHHYAHERWLNEDHKVNIKKISESLIRHKAKSVTLSELFKISKKELFI